MTYQINSLETAGGIATETEVQIQDRFTTGDQMIIYYDLRDPQGTTQVRGVPSNDYVTLPYSILSHHRILVVGGAFSELSAGNILPIDILLAKRPDIRLKKRTVLLFDDCFGKELGEFYLDNEDFSKASNIYIDEGLKEPIKYDGKISDNNYVGIYSSKSGLQEIVPC